MKRWILLAALLCGVGCVRPTVKAPVSVITAKASAPAAIDYEAEFLKLWPDATVRSGMFEAPHSRQLYYVVVSGNKAMERSDYETTEAHAWRDAYYRNKYLITAK